MIHIDAADNSIRDRLLECIAQADNTPEQLATEMNMSLADLSRWIMTGENLRLIEGVARLSDVRAQMILSRYRANAALHLIAVAGASEPSENSRKACVDLLTTDLPVFNAVSSIGTSTTAPPSEQTILETLERLAEEADARNAEDPPPVPVRA